MNIAGPQDVTKRYVSNYMTTTRKLRFEEAWISGVLAPFAGANADAAQDSREDQELVRIAEEAPMPTTVRLVLDGITFSIALLKGGCSSFLGFLKMH